MDTQIITEFKRYQRNSLKDASISWWDLHKGTKVGFRRPPLGITLRGETITVKRLLSVFGKDPSLNKKITHVMSAIKNPIKLRLSFPIDLNNLAYVHLYALMISEGSKRSEFAIHVPELEFHQLFRESIKDLLGADFADSIREGSHAGVGRSRASCLVRYLVPLPQHIPHLVMANKEYAREYLRVAFEAEGSAILNLQNHKRYIKLSRNIDVTPLLKGKLNYPIGQRIFFGQFKKEHPNLAINLLKLLPELLYGECLLLNYHFGIRTKLNLENIRINKTNLRAGKISAKWVLYIYADSIDRFIEELGFISERKNHILQEMKSITPRKQKFSSFDIITRISQNGTFRSLDFEKEMRKLGYKSPRAYLSRYIKAGLIRNIRRGVYSITCMSTRRLFP